jgi:putative DNA primase/helicase
MTKQLPLHPRDEFAAALRDIGCIVTDEHPIMDGKTHRIATEGDRRGERAGFYVAYLDGHPAGYAKNHRTGVERRWKATAYHVDPAAQANLRAEAAAKQHQRAVEQARSNEETAKRLEQELGRLAPVTFPTAYMQTKGIGTHPGVYTDAEGKTCVPATDAAGKLWTVQSIDAEGRKRFAKASRKHGCFHAIGGLARLGSADVLVIAEGYATAATVTELLGRPAVAAFDAGNLLPVAQALHAKFPGKPVLVVADDDQAQERDRGINPGRQKAHEAARAVGGRVVVPIFAPAEQRESPKAFSDFNDLAVRSVLGRDGAASQLKYAYEQALHEKSRRVVNVEQQRPRQADTAVRARAR